MSRLIAALSLVVATMSPLLPGDGTSDALKAAIAKLNDPVAENRVEGLRTLASLGPKASAALPKVADLFHDANIDVRFAAADAMGRMGPRATSILILKLSARDKETRYLAAVSLSLLGPDGEKAIPALIARLKDTEWDVRFKSAYALGQMAPASRKAIPHLVRMLVEEKDAAQQQAYESLLRFGDLALPGISIALNHKSSKVRAFGLSLLAHRLAENPTGVLPYLLEAIQSPHVDVRAAALTHLQSIHNAPVAKLTAALKDELPQIRELAAAAILKQDDLAKAKSALEAALVDAHEPVQNLAVEGLSRLKIDVNANLLGLLKDMDLARRFQAARLLFQRDPNSEAALSVHLHILSSDDGPLRRAAAYLLAKTKLPLAKPAIPVIAQDLSHKDPNVIHDALLTLYYIIPFDQDSALPPFAKLIKHPDARVRQVVGFALSRFDKRGWNLVVELAKDDNVEVRCMLYSAIGENVRDTPDVLPLLKEKALNDPSEAGRRAALYSMDWFGAKAVAPFYHDVYKKANDATRQTILESSVRFGVNGQAAIPLFIDALKDSVPRTRQLAAYGLRPLGSQARVAIPALKAALTDPDPEVREAVAGTLEMISR